MTKVYVSPSVQDWNKGVNGYGTEEKRMNDLADVIVPLLRANGFTVYRNRPEWNLNKVVSDSNSKIGPKDIHLALHTNAGGGEGTEVYYYHGSKEGKELAQRLYDYIAPETKSKDRGVKANRTFAELKGTDGVAVLIEYMFHDNKDDVSEWLSSGEIQRQAEHTVRAICEFKGKKFKKLNEKPVTNPSTPQVKPKPAPVASTKTVSVLAKEVIDGKHGTGEARKKSLGSRYNEVQKEVNRLLSDSKKPKAKAPKTISQLADEVVKGMHGSGRERMISLGSNYAAVQKEVNKRMR